LSRTLRSRCAINFQNSRFRIKQLRSAGTRKLRSDLQKLLAFFLKYQTVADVNLLHAGEGVGMFTSRGDFCLFAVLAFAFRTIASGQSVPARALVTSSVNESVLITLHGNTRPELQKATDLGPVDGSRVLNHVFLQLKRPPEREEALEDYLDDLHSTKSVNFHRWGTSAQFAERFGLAQQDITAVTDWLQSHNLTVNHVFPNLLVDFSGTVADVAAAFRTTIHRVEWTGVAHIANVSDPQIPAALAPVVAGPVSLNDFKPRASIRPRATYTVAGGSQLVVPADLHTIYNFNPVYKAGITGMGQTIAVMEESDLYSAGDWNTFRKTLGLTLKFPFGKLETVHPQPGSGGNCDDPGVNDFDGEATLDVEWASAAAPNATIVLASCADTEATSGLLIALQNLLTNGSTPPAVVSISFGTPEANFGAGGNAYVNSLYQLAVFEGVSVFVSSGDAGAAVADQRFSFATHGIGVNGLASTPNDVAVGGTDFGDTFLLENAAYWNAINAPLTYESAKSYVPEIPWNNSCASQLVALAFGFPATFGADGACNSSFGETFLLTTTAGSGGPSGCASGSSSIPGVVSGTCSGYAKPFYQRFVFGNPSDGVRDVPDISLFAGSGFWSHYYVFCYSDLIRGGSTCNNPPSSWAGAGGTSFSTPIMAGLQSLINQVTGARQGNPNYVYYVLAGLEYGASGNAACNSTLGKAADTTCTFYDVTLGDMDVPCAPLATDSTATRFSCFYPSTNPGDFGVLSTSNTSFRPAFASSVGWDFATGIGSVNANNLVVNWPGSALAPSLSAASRSR